MSKTLLSIGHGYSARALGKRLVAKGWTVIATTRSHEKARSFTREGLSGVIWPGQPLPICEATHILTSVAPDDVGDPVLAEANEALQSAHHLEWVGYLSTTGVYGQISDRNLRQASPATQASVLLPDYLERFGYRTAGAGKMFHNGDRARVFDEFGNGTNFGPKPKDRFHFDPAWFDDREGSTQTDWGVFPGVDEKMPDHQTANWVIEWINQTDNTKSIYIYISDMRTKPVFVLHYAMFCTLNANFMSLFPWMIAP